MKRRILSFSLAFLLLVQLVSVSVYAEGGTIGADMVWTLEDGVLTIGGSGDMDDISSNIPWLWSSPSIRKIVVKDGVTSVSEKAFQNCMNVTDVSLPEGLSDIGKMAFAGMRKLTEINIPGGLETIGSGAFMDCASLSSVTLPASLKKINAGAFNNCGKLSHVYYQGTSQQWAGVKIATDNGGNDALLNAEFHYSGSQGQQQSIGGEFGNSLTWTFRDGTLILQGKGDFRYGTLPWVNFRKDIIHIRVEDGITGIRRAAFSGCRNLQDITLSDSITSIGDEAFFGCDSITEITLSDHIRIFEKITFQSSCYLMM